MSRVWKNLDGWQESTCNSWMLSIQGYHVASVVRHRSWKSRRDAKPWHVEIFGSRFVRDLAMDDNRFGTLQTAEAAAEALLSRMVHELSDALRTGA